MSKAQRIRQQSARERIAAQQAAARRAEQRRKMLWFGGAIVVVIAVVVTLVVVKLGQNSAKTSASASSTTGTPLPASVSKNVTNVPVSVLTSVGAGSVPSYNSKAVTTITGPTLTSASKPEMLYIGAEFCPYCAAMRWSMAVALSRFGTLSPLHGSHSSSTDTDPNTPTLTFYKSSYTSKYLTFVPVENETITHGPLQNTTAAQSAIWAKYEPNTSQRGYPFIDFGNRYMITGPIFDPAVLAGLSWQQVAADLHNPSSPVAQGAIGAANYITAAICKITNNAPASVCTTPPASTLEPKL